MRKIKIIATLGTTEEMIQNTGSLLNELGFVDKGDLLLLMLTDVD